MSNNTGPSHIVVDGSNIATEGRSMPSLQQLSEAVTAFMADYPDVPVTVVVDATFGHRIDKSERAEFDEAVANNELVAPPAGAVGRGDAFVLNIARKSGATVLSNDSFQEFHGTHEWLFDEGRLIGGKPVPTSDGYSSLEHPCSRHRVASGDEGLARDRVETGKATATASASKSKSTGKAKSSPLASEPMPTPKTPPPGAATVNELVPFLDFVERHPVGTSCTGVGRGLLIPWGVPASRRRSGVRASTADGRSASSERAQGHEVGGERDRGHRWIRARPPQHRRRVTRNGRRDRPDGSSPLGVRQQRRRL